MKKIKLLTKRIDENTVKYGDNEPIKLPFTVFSPKIGVTFHAPVCDENGVIVYQTRDDGVPMFDNRGKRIPIEETIELKVKSKKNATYKHSLSGITLDSDSDLHVIDAVLKRFYSKGSSLTSEEGIQRIREPERYAEIKRQEALRANDVNTIEMLKKQLEATQKKVSDLEKKKEKK